MDIHCPTEVMAVGTIIFPVRVGEQFFFQYGLEFIESFQLQVFNKNSNISRLFKTIKLAPICYTRQRICQKWKKDTVTGTLIPHQRSNLLLEYDMYFKVKNLYFCKDIRAIQKHRL